MKSSARYAQVIWTGAILVLILLVVTGNLSIAQVTDAFAWIGGIIKYLFTSLWSILLFIVFLPLVLGLVLDGKGQSAAGWLVFIGLMGSGLLGVAYLIGMVVYLLIRLVFP